MLLIQFLLSKIICFPLSFQEAISHDSFSVALKENCSYFHQFRESFGFHKLCFTEESQQISTSFCSQRRGVLFAKLIRTCVLEKLVDFLLQVKGICSVATWPCTLHFPLENVARKFPQIPLVCVCVQLQNLTLRPWFGKRNHVEKRTMNGGQRTANSQFIMRHRPWFARNNSRTERKDLETNQKTNFTKNQGQNGCQHSFNKPLLALSN